MIAVRLAAPRLKISFKRKFSGFAVVDLIQSTLVQVHNNGLPWWLVFGNCTVGFRLLLFPLVRKQIVESSLLKNAIPEINILTMMFKNKLSSTEKVDKLQLTSAYIDGIRATLTLHDIYPSRIFAPIALNFSVFVTFVYSIRSFIMEGSLTDGNIHSSLENGGLFWFQNLTQCDGTFVLPCLSIGLSYCGIIYAFKAQAPAAGTALNAAAALPGPMLFMKEAVLTSLLLSLPVVASLPAGVFMYWIPNSCYSMLQTYLLRNQSFRKLIRVQAA